MKTIKRTISLLLTFALLFTLAATAAAQQAETDYLLMGDSIAQGFGVKNPEEASYGAIVANTNGYNYYNIGRSARTTEGLLIQVTENEYARSLIKDAEIISLSIGGNDYFTDEGVVGIAVGLVAGIETPRYKQLTANMIENFAKIIDEIKALNPDVVILAQTVLCSWYGLLGGAYKHGTNTVNDMIYGYLEEHPGAYEIVDVATAMNGHREFIARDSVHPNAEGNIVIARLVLQKLKELGLGENTEPVLIAEGIEYDYYVEEYGEAAGKFIGFIVRLATGHNPF